ncbi:maleylpyruvate isomerase N-terminal domain-containing protein [Ferruginibacter sp.]
MSTPQHIPIKTLHLFPVLDNLLIELLQSLTDKEWNAATIAKLWTVKDIAAHLLDGNLRTLSSSRDKYFSETPQNMNSYNDLVACLNQLNHSWTNAAKRLSPQVLINLLEITGKQYAEHLNSLNPFNQAIYSVAWAGEEVSQNWFHIAREYTEKFIHQQQIRDAVGKEGILTKELFSPFIITMMYALPYTYKNIPASTGTTVTVKIISGIGGQWSLIKTTSNWEFTNHAIEKADATITMDPKIAWKLFSKGITATEAIDKVEINGNVELGKAALNMVSFMV